MGQQVSESQKQIVEQIKEELKEEVKSQVEQKVEEQANQDEQPKALFDVLISPVFGKSSSIFSFDNLVNFVGLILIGVSLLFVIYRIDRRRMLKRIDEIKRIKEL